jgi:hypothetical protein
MNMHGYGITTTREVARIVIVDQEFSQAYTSDSKRSVCIMSTIVLLD